MATSGLFAAPDILDPGVVNSRASTTHNYSLIPAARECGSAHSATAFPAKDESVRPGQSSLYATAQTMTAPEASLPASPGHVRRVAVVGVPTHEQQHIILELSPSWQLTGTTGQTRQALRNLPVTTSSCRRCRKARTLK